AREGNKRNMVNVSGKGKSEKRRGISQPRHSIISRHDRRSNPEAAWRENVAQFAIGILDKSYAGRAVRIVLDPHNLRWDTALAPLEIDLSIFLFVTAANVPRCEPAVVVATAGLFLRLDEAPFTAPLRDFIESRQRLETQRRR